MMTTGYDCPDILNLGLMRPIFSPQDFVQIKGRGTRKHNFLEQLFDQEIKEMVKEPEKSRFKLFDFFANCEYFEEKYNYDEVIKLPRPSTGSGGEGPVDPPPPPAGLYESTAPDALLKIAEEQVGFDGMKIDRMFFEKFEGKVKDDPVLKETVEAEQWDKAIEHVHTELFEKPEEYFNLDKLRKAAGIDRRVSVREILEKIFGLIPYFKPKDELLEDEFQKFVLDCKPDDAMQITAMKYFFKAYATDGRLREIIDHKRLTELNVNPTFSMADFKAVPPKWRTRIPNYVKDYVTLNKFM